MKLAVRLALSCVAAALVASPAPAFWWCHRPIVVVNVGGAPAVSGAYGAAMPSGGCYGHRHFGHHAPVMMAPVGAPYGYAPTNYGAPAYGAGCTGGYGAPPPPYGAGCTGGYGAPPPSGSGCSGGYGAPPPCPPDKKTVTRIQQIDRKLDELLAAVRTGVLPVAKGTPAAPDDVTARARAWQKDELTLAERIRHWQENGAAAIAGNREPAVAPARPAAPLPADATANFPALTRAPNP